MKRTLSKAETSESSLVKPIRSRLLSRVGLSHAEPAAAAPLEFSSDGITIRHTTIQATDPLGFEWVGGVHYLALHHMHMTDGETCIEEVPAAHLRDLRGTLTFVPAGCRAWGWGKPRPGRQWFTALYFDPQKMQEEIAGKFRNLSLRPRLYFSDSALCSTLEKLKVSLVNGPERMYVETLCMAAALELTSLGHVPAYVPVAGRGRLTHPQEARVRDYVQAHLHTEISLGDLAAIAGLSRFHFVRVFQQTTGQTPYQFLITCRMQKARHLLAHSALPVAQVAAAVGYKDGVRFTRAFSNVLRVTPLQYRAASSKRA